MTGNIGWLLLASAIFLGMHTIVSGTPLRGAIVAAVKDGPYMGFYSLINLAALVWMVLAFNAAPRDPVWDAPAGLAWLPILVMPFALVLLAAGVRGKSPTALGGKGAPESPGEPAGIQRVTRHPVNSAILLWAAAHLIATGDLASLIFFGTFAVVAGVGPYLIDRKRGVKFGPDWDGYAAKTSVYPFVAIAGGRNKFVAAEIGWRPVVIGLVLYALLLGGHPWLFGVTVLPW